MATRSPAPTFMTWTPWAERPTLAMLSTVVRMTMPLCGDEDQLVVGA